MKDPTGNKAKDLHDALKAFVDDDRYLESAPGGGAHP